MVCWGNEQITKTVRDVLGKYTFDSMRFDTARDDLFPFTSEQILFDQDTSIIPLDK